MQLRSNSSTPPTSSTSASSADHHEESPMAAAHDSLALSHLAIAAEHQRLANHHQAEARAAQAEADLASQPQVDVDRLTNELLLLSHAGMQSLVSRLLDHSRNGNPVADSMLAAVASVVQPAIFAPPTAPLRNQQHACVVVGPRQGVQHAHLQLVQHGDAAAGCIISPVAPIRIHAVGIVAAAAAAAERRQRRNSEGDIGSASSSHPSAE